MPSLVAPLAAGDLRLPNRVVMAPLTRMRSRAGNAPGPLNALYYAQRASAGLIVSEATQISPQGLGYPGTPGIHDTAQVEGWRLVTDAVHARGGRIALQLWHVGRISHPDLQPGGALPVAPSAVRPDGQAITPTGMKPFVTPRALAADEIPRLVADYAAAARKARDAGFDGVEVHGANGYLIDQFLQDGSNRREDRYGGSIANRSRFLLEVVDAVADVWGAARVGVRLSPHGTFNDMRDSDPDTLFAHVVRELDGRGLAYLHLIEPRASDAGMQELAGAAPATCAARFRPLWRGALIAAGGFDADGAHAAVAQGIADAVAFGRLFIANPDLPRRLHERTALNAYDRSTFYGGDARGYTDYPALDAPAREAAAS